MKYWILMAAITTSLTAGAQSDWKNYSFIVPAKWFVTTAKDHVKLSQSQEETGCIITILEPQPSSGNLEKDVVSVFGMMYPGWSFRNTGAKQYDLSKGYTPQGLEYYLMEGNVSKARPDGYYYDYEDGAAMVVGFGAQVAIISARHNRLIACNCFNQYDGWRRFFNSFTVKNQTAAKNADSGTSQRIIGSWMTMGSGAATEYVLAANGNYQFIGAYGSSSTQTRGNEDYMILKGSAWQGDGKYTVSGDQITFLRRGDAKPERVRFRLEKVNHGGTGWNDRLYMRKIDATLGKEYEVCYERRQHN
jgi:hypothetical protein